MSFFLLVPVALAVAMLAQQQVLCDDKVCYFKSKWCESGLLWMIISITKRLSIAFCVKAAREKRENTDSTVSRAISSTVDRKKAALDRKTQ